MDALRLIDSDPPHAVVLDLGLPLISGQVVRQEVAQAHTRHISVIVVTGQAGDHERLDVVCVLRKPPSDMSSRSVRASTRQPAPSR